MSKLGKAALLGLALLPLGMFALGERAIMPLALRFSNASAYLGTWHIQLKPEGAGEWRGAGHTHWASLGSRGTMTGVWYREGEPTGQTLGNALVGAVGLSDGQNMITVDGRFTRNTFSGRYESVGPGFTGKATGDIRMARR